MATKSERLARLLDARAEDVDVEDADAFDDGTRARVGGDEGSRNEATALGAPTYRADIDMGDDPKYAGVPVSVAKLRRRRRRGGGAAAAGNGESESSEDDEEEEEEEEEEEQGDSDESMAGEESEEEEEGARVPQIDTGDIEAELAALEAEDAAATMQLQKQSQGSAKKAEHARRQIGLWEVTLEARIGMQAALTTANRLPPHGVVKAMTKSEPKLKMARAKACVELGGLLDDLAELQDATAQASSLKIRRKRPRPQAADVDPIHGHWQRINEWWGEALPQLESVVDEWQQRLMYSSGLTAKKQLKQVHQPIARQVDGVLEHKDRLLRRCRVEASPNTRVLGTTLHADEAAAAAARARAQKGKQAAASGDSAAVCGSAVGQLNPDTFNDTEFYEHLLRELIKWGAAGAQTAQDGVRAKRRGSSKSSVDRKASKGRRLRYQSHAKLTNFMAPVPPPPPPLDLDSLHASLFRSTR